MSDSKVNEKKVVGITVAIALGIICILLIAVIAYFSITGISAQNSYNNLQNQNKQLQTWLTENVSQNENLQNQNSQLQTWLYGNETQYANIINLENYTIWVNDQTVSEPAGGIGIAYNYWYESAYYAGYVSIIVTSATAGAWTTVTYSTYGINYNDSTNVGISGIAYFPVLPSSSITVGVGNGNLVNGANQTVTIIYYY